MVTELLSSVAAYVDVTTTTLFFVVAYLTWKYYHGYNLPPGPWGLPLLGYLPFVPQINPEVTFNKLSKRYGNVMSFYFGGSLVVILNNFEAIKEAYVKQADNFAGKTEGSSEKPNKKSTVGLFTDEGKRWKNFRRFVMSTLRDYGMGKLSLEPRITEEIHFALNELAKEKGKPFDPQRLLSLSTANVIATMEFGKRFDYTDARFNHIRDLQDEQLDLFSHLNPKEYFPFLKWFEFLEPVTKENRYRYINIEIAKFIKDLMTEHQAEYRDNSRKDLIDAIITETQANIERTGSKGNFDDNAVVGTLTGLFLAGTETTASMLRWAILFLMIHPDVQKKVQKEIDDVIGMERVPTMADRLKMVYSEAVLLEVQRFGAPLPLNSPHTNVEETEVLGHRIPKRTKVLINIWAVHNDPKLWDQPEKFMPERFINKDGKLEKPEYLIPFGIGKRACAGEALARMELFLFFTSLLQRFSFESPKGVTPVLKFESKLVRRPKTFEVCAIERPGYNV